MTSSTATTTIIAQCPACRALMGVSTVVVDGSRNAGGIPRAGLPCSACGAVAWLPLSTGVTVTSSSGLAALPAATTMSLPPPDAVPLTVPVVIEPATTPAPPPATMSTAMVTAFDDATLDKIRARLALTTPAESQIALAERFESLLTSRWQTETEHKGLLKMAAAAGELAFVGGRYRAVLDVVREEPRARAAQAELLTMAMATMSSQALTPATDTAPGNGKVIAGAILAIAIGAGVFFMMQKMMGSLAAAGGP